MKHYQCQSGVYLAGYSDLMLMVSYDRSGTSLHCLVRVMINSTLSPACGPSIFLKTLCSDSHFVLTVISQLASTVQRRKPRLREVK